MRLLMSGLFITGTDTGVGKTFVGAHLLKFLRDRGVRACYQKWVSTGEGGKPQDLLFCLDFAGFVPGPNLFSSLAPYCFTTPASPHLAAQLEGREINPDVLIRCTKELQLQFDLVLVEGVGGVLVPLRRDLLLADFLSSLFLPTLVVARSGLGTLNHTLLTLEALKTRKVPVLGVVFSDEKQAQDDIVITDNVRTIQEISGTEVFGRLPRYDFSHEACEAFRKIGEKILLAFNAHGHDEPDAESLPGTR